MNRDQIAGKWEQVRGKAKERWGRLTNDDLDRIAGRREQLVGRLREAYGWSVEQVDEAIDEFERNLADGREPAHVGSR